MKLKSICISIVDAEHKTAPRANEGFPSIRTPNIGKGRLKLEGVYRVSKETYIKWTRRAIPQANDLILAREAPVGNVAIVPDNLNLCLGQRTVLIRPDTEKINPQFLCYYLLSDEIQNKMTGMSSGATVAHLNMKDIRELELTFLPLLKTQKRIADILSAYDDLIENNLKRIKLLEQAAQNIYKEWFVNLRFPRHENTPINKETGLPDGWEEKEISTIITFLGGYAFKSKTYIENGKYRVITIKNVGDKVFNASVGNSVSIIPEKMKEHCKIIEGDILLSLTGNVGRSCIAYGENNLLNQRVAKIEPINTRWRPYIYWMFNDNKIFSLMNNLATGAAQQNLSPVKLAKEKVVIPSESFIDLFCLKANSFFKQIILLNKQNQKLKAARDILLPRLMNRTIEV